MKYNLPPAFFIFTNHSNECLILYRFIEYGEYKNNYYGTSIDSVRSVLAKNKVCLLDVQPHVSKQSVPFLVSLLRHVKSPHLNVGWLRKVKA